jgi:hypothetical protein
MAAAVAVKKGWRAETRDVEVERTERVEAEER